MSELKGPAGRGADDFIAIERLILEFAYRFDQGDLDGAAAVIGTGSLRYLAGQEVLAEAHNIDEIRQLVGSAKLFEDGTPRTQHVITNIRIDIDASWTTADSFCYVTAFHTDDEGSRQVIATGNYRDRFENGVAGWQFSRRDARLQDARGGAISPGCHQD